MNTSLEPGLRAPDEANRLTGTAAVTVFWAAVAFSAFQIYTAAYSPLSSLVMRSLHVGFLMFLGFALYRAVNSGLHGAGATRVPWHDWLLGGAGFALAFYHWVFEGDLILRDGDPTAIDLMVGAAVVVMLFELARRVMGWALPLICLAFLLYGLFGQYLPGDLATRGYGFDQVVGQLYLGGEGIYGIPILVSSTYIFLFILFGTFLEQAGMLRLFNDLALGTVGHTVGGPAKVAVISSGLMGTINGSGVANVVSTGQFTIPLMKRFGYRAEFAGGVEATASMGGQIMPPVMGAVAFIMAETLDIPYAEVAVAAALPAILYYISAFWMVHLEAMKQGLHGLPADQCPSARKALAANWYLLAPLAILVYLLFAGFTPLFAGTVTLGLTATLILGSGIAKTIGPLGLRMLFWIAIGLGASAFFRWGITATFFLIALLVGIVLFVKGGRETLRIMLNSLVEGPRSALPVGIACALVGIIIGIMTLTGLGSSLARIIIGTAGDSMLLALIMTMIVSLFLGMGIPTIPNYIITSSLAAPALKGMGVEPLVSHMFVFYFGIMADLTPPVALAAFAAASIAKASPMKIGFMAVRIALAGFVIPFMFVYDPALLMQSDDPLAIAYIAAKALLAIALWGGASVAYLMGPLNWPERGLAVIAAAFLVAAAPVTDEIGFVLSAVFFAWRWLRQRRVAAA